MKLLGLTTSVAAALVIGIVQAYLLILCWAYIAMYTPLPQWLIAHGVTGTSLRAVLFATDFSISVLLSIPAAFLLCVLQPRQLVLYLLLAVVPGFLWQYSNLLEDTSVLNDWQLFLPGALSFVLALPVAAFIAQRTKPWVAPNNSFKPKPLRGSA